MQAFHWNALRVDANDVGIRLDSDDHESRRGRPGRSTT
jgi:hypothetical protein